MKKILLALCCVLFSGVGACACRGRLVAMLGELADTAGCGRTIARKMSSSAVITPGFRPTSKIQLPIELVNPHVFPKRVSFLDKDHSLFVVPEEKQSFNGEPPTVTQEDDHSVRVNLKKK